MPSLPFPPESIPWTVKKKPTLPRAFPAYFFS